MGNIMKSFIVKAQIVVCDAKGRIRTFASERGDGYKLPNAIADSRNVGDRVAKLKNKKGVKNRQLLFKRISERLVDPFKSKHKIIGECLIGENRYIVIDPIGIFSTK